MDWLFFVAVMDDVMDDVKTRPIWVGAGRELRVLLCDLAAQTAKARGGEPHPEPGAAARLIAVANSAYGLDGFSRGLASFHPSTALLGQSHVSLFSTTGIGRPLSIGHERIRAGERRAQEGARGACGRVLFRRDPPANPCNPRRETTRPTSSHHCGFPHRPLNPPSTYHPLYNAYRFYNANAILAL